MQDTARCLPSNFVRAARSPRYAIERQPRLLISHGIWAFKVTRKQGRESIDRLQFDGLIFNFVRSCAANADRCVCVTKSKFNACNVFPNSFQFHNLRFESSKTVGATSREKFPCPYRVRVRVVGDCGNNNGVVLISRLQPRYRCRNYASKIHLLPALTNFRQTWFPRFRKYLLGSAAVIPASRRFTALPFLLLVRPSLQPWKISRDYDFFQVPSKRDLDKIRFLAARRGIPRASSPDSLASNWQSLPFFSVSFYRRFGEKAWFVACICS